MYVLHKLCCAVMSRKKCVRSSCRNPGLFPSFLCKTHPPPKSIARALKKSHTNDIAPRLCAFSLSQREEALYIAYIPIQPDSPSQLRYLLEREITRYLFLQLVRNRRPTGDRKKSESECSTLLDVVSSSSSSSSFLIIQQQSKDTFRFHHLPPFI